MSGKKSSEVASVLTSAERKQDEIIEKYRDNTEKILLQCEEVLKKLGEDNSEVKKARKLLTECSDRLSKNRKRSKEIREAIRNKSHYCDSEYREAKILKTDNDSIEGSYSKIYIDSTKLLTTCNSQYEKEVSEFWSREKAKIEERFLLKSYYSFKNHYIEGKFVEINLEEFVKLYTPNKLNEIEGIKKFLKESCPEEKKDAITAINRINEVIGGLEEKANKVVTKVENEASLCSSIFDAMEDLGFTVEYSHIIEGEMITGYKIKCRNGDSIDFTTIKYNEDGEPVAEINHAHGKNYNNCGIKWKDIKKHFNKIGISLTTVRQDGKHAIDWSETKTPGPKKTIKERSRGGR